MQVMICSTRLEHLYTTRFRAVETSWWDAQYVDSEERWQNNLTQRLEGQSRRMDPHGNTPPIGKGELANSEDVQGNRRGREGISFITPSGASGSRYAGANAVIQPDHSSLGKGPRTQTAVRGREDDGNHHGGNTERWRAKRGSLTEDDRFYTHANFSSAANDIHPYRSDMIAAMRNTNVEDGYALPLQAKFTEDSFGIRPPGGGSSRALQRRNAEDPLHSAGQPELDRRYNERHEREDISRGGLQGRDRIFLQDSPYRHNTGNQVAKQINGTNRNECPGDNAYFDYRNQSYAANAQHSREYSREPSGSTKAEGAEEAIDLRPVVQPTAPPAQSNIRIFEQ